MTEELFNPDPWAFIASYGCGIGASRSQNRQFNPDQGA